MRVLLRLLKTVPSLVTLSSSALAVGNDWMTPLNGTLPISQYSLPGTHDSGARFEPISGTAKCQDLTIADQLAAGVRFLDIRCRHVKDAFDIHHGVIFQKANFNDVLNAVIAFLDANPGEAVIMSVKEEATASGNTRSFEATFDSYAAKNPSKWQLGASIPTLDAARGKITLFRRFVAASTAPKGIDASNFPDDITFGTGNYLRVQDHYNVSDNDTKWDYILAILNEARHGSPDTLYVNFASGVMKKFLDVPDITSVSNDINPRLTSFFNANPSGRFGAVLMDFADPAKCSLIYNTNAPAATPSPSP